MVSPTEMNATVTLRIGPVEARFKGTVELSDLVPPEGYTISGEGKGGAKVKLTEEGDETLLHYDVKADIGCKLAQLGSRLIDSTSNELAGQFFKNFGNVLDERVNRPGFTGE